MRRLSKRVRALFVTAAIMLVITCGLTVTAYAVNGVEKNRICEGIFVDDIDLGGLTEQEAENKIEDYVDRITGTRVFVDIDGRGTAETTLAVLGLTADGTDCVKEALAIGKKGNPIKRYKDVQDTQENGVHYDITFSFKEGSALKYLEAQGAMYDIEAVSAAYTRENGEFIISDHVEGRKMDAAATAKQLTDYVLNDWNMFDDIYIEAKVDVVAPDFTSEDLAECTTLLGSYTTDYSPVGTGRATNVENGARLVDGSYLLPGDILSVDEKLRPYTIENGYGVGGQYVNGEVVDSVGGGICQVSTTLYNAVLYSELEVVERAAHSMTVTYVPLSRDAAIAGDYKDFKFCNNTERPLYVEGIAKGGKITFNIYGYETRDTEHRSIDFEYEILETKKPGEDIVKEDPKQPKGYEKVTQNPFNGYTACLYKIEYKDGKQVSKTKINTSIYKASPRYVTIGTGKEKKGSKKKDVEDEDYEDEDFEDDDYDEDYEDDDYEDDDVAVSADDYEDLLDDEDSEENE